ncbi:MAG TPA: hypothetical protein VMZ28_31510 [Kofleriaceae bacterium]|nr:hypothetical protein [Kofleriaceae bacterium]
MGRSYALGVLALVSACSFTADFSGKRFRCEIDRDCPDGVTCGADGLCGVPAAGDDGGAGACVDGDMPETFAGGPPCEPWGSATADGATTTEEDGALVVAPAPDMAITFGGCVTHEGVDFAAGVFTEVSQVLPADAPSAYTSFNLYSTVVGTSPFALSMTVHAGTLTAYLDDVNRQDVTYDPQLMRWWRVRPAGDDILFETAPDGLEWSLLVAVPSPPFDLPVVNVGAGTSDAEASPGSARFEGVNVCPDL